MVLPEPERLARFVRRAEEAGSTVSVVKPSALADAVRDLAAPDEPIIVSPSALSAWSQLDSIGGIVGPPGVGSYRRVSLGVVTAAMAVAETGSTAVDETDLADRHISMTSDTLVRIIGGGAIVDTLEEFIRWLDGQRAGYRALITGPSRTADIERSLTIGVQGPQRDHVLVVSV